MFLALQVQETATKQQNVHFQAVHVARKISHIYSRGENNEVTTRQYMAEEYALIHNISKRSSRRPETYRNETRKHAEKIDSNNERTKKKKPRICKAACMYI